MLQSLQTIRENTQIFTKASKDIGLEINSEKTKYMITSRQQNIEVENVEKFKYLGATVTNTNVIHEEIKCRINMGNACCYSLEKILSSRQLSKKLKVNTYKTIILPVVLFGCET